MTHEELLAICDNYSFKDSAEPVKALRAVVELHKPEPIPANPVFFICTHCTEGNDGGYVWYPCPTIQAIQEQLK